MEINIILEILGRPASNVTEALQTIITKIGSEKGVKILSKQIHEPIPVEDTKDLFTAFAEISLEVDSTATYINLIFSYMPSHIEIVKPENTSLSNIDLNDLANNLVRRLHHYDAVAKQMLAEKEIILKQLYQHAPQLFKKQESSQQQAPQENPKLKNESKQKKDKKANKKKKK